ncbi:MAG: glutamate-5-semialdehyde dehydrogenase [Chloroflexota bacterium]
MRLLAKELEDKGARAKDVSKRLASLGTEVKDRALGSVGDALVRRQDEILAANREDYRDAQTSGLSAPMLDRLLLDEGRIASMASDVRAIAALPDPVGEVMEMRSLPNGLLLGKRRVPLGVIGAIYESRPNVTIDISSLCLKSGNAVILRGGRETIRSNMALARVAQEACREAGVPEGCLQLIESTDHTLVDQMLGMKDVVDLVIPRGGPALIKLVSEKAAMPVVTGGIGVCHTYVDRGAERDMAVAIAYNAKVQRPTVCNALDCLLVHRDVAQSHLPAVAKEWAKAGVEIHADERAMEVLGSDSSLLLTPANDEDWGKEYLSLNVAVRVVDSFDEALEHIETYGSGHSEAIVTRDYDAAMRFVNEVDTACVYVNASTRFTDGSQFGLGAEIGISTQKFHARGPMALRELTSYKWIAFGSGQVRS